jgi:pseudouridine 5'-phosphatase
MEEIGIENISLTRPSRIPVRPEQHVFTGEVEPSRSNHCRAMLFDMDGLILDTEDRYTQCTNTILARYSRPPLPWSVKAKLQGRPGHVASAILHDWAKLPISHEEYFAQLSVIQEQLFPESQPLPGVEELLKRLETARTIAGDKVNVALATSSNQRNFKLKTAHLQDLFAVFEEHRRVLGDDPRIPQGRGKPAPDIYLLALKTINESLAEGEAEVRPEECLVFEDSVPGVEAGRRAGMRVVWVPHPELYAEYRDRVDEVLAGRTGEGGDVDLHQLGEVGDGWAEYLPSLEGFDYAKYGIVA